MTTADAILALLRDLGAKYPKSGWDTVQEIEGFHERINEMAGGNHPHFVAALESVGLTRFEAAEAFRIGKHAEQIRETKHAGRAPAPAKPLPARPIPAPPMPADPGGLVPAQPPGDPQAAKPGTVPDRTGKRGGVATPVARPDGDPGVRRPIHRKEKQQPVSSPEPQKTLL